MAKSKSEILNDFQEFMGRHGANYRDWYVGTSADPKQQMFGAHKFKNGDKGLFRQALSELQAAEVAEFFTGLGAKGNATPTRNAEFVYAYKRASHTKP
ncbi:MAG: IS1 family transposase [Rhodospirillaceae bacterium]|nr:IS1 family transposase [Rhodospirillaceae bacterium]